MTRILSWLLNTDLSSISKGGPLHNWYLGWDRPLPVWVWLLGVAIFIVLASWGYRGLIGKRKARGFLAVIRFALLVLVLVFMAGPALIFPDETIEQDWVVMLVDRSRSMGIADVDSVSGGSNNSAGRRITREAQLKNLLGVNQPVLGKVAAGHYLSWTAFDSTAYDLMVDSASGLPITDSDPDGNATNIGSAIQQSLRRLGARPVSAVVLFSDGRATGDTASTAYLRQLQSESIPVFVIPLGAEEPVGDLAISNIEAPSRAYVNDHVPILVDIEQYGEIVGSNSCAEVSLVDEETGEVLDSVTLPVNSVPAESPGGGFSSAVKTVVLTALPQKTGVGNWRVRVSSARPDLIESNNVAEVKIDLLDTPLQVLYVEGYPRWEYRYLKNLLVRESSINSSVMLLSADPDFAQEGNSPVTRLPNSFEEWSDYDVIILGDVRSDYFSPLQHEAIRRQVGDNGAGLLWISGARANPATYTGTLLAGLLPYKQLTEVISIGMPVTMRPTELAKMLGIMQIRKPVSGVAVAGMKSGQDAWEELSDPLHGWTQLRWALHMRKADLKPTVEVLAETVQLEDSVSGNSSNGGGNMGTGGLLSSSMPLVTQMRFGAGRTVFVATDEIWRWRYGRGESYGEQFWIQLVRLLGRDRLEMVREQAQLMVSPEKVEAGQPLVVELKLLDSALLDLNLSEIRVTVSRIENDGDKASDTGVTQGGNGGVFDSEEIILQAVGEGLGRYSAIYFSDRPGLLRFSVKESAMGVLGVESTARVYLPDVELRSAFGGATDHEFLRSLAEQTGGEVFTQDNIASLPELLPNRSIRIPNDVSVSLWDTPLFFVLFMLLIIVEWVGRRLLHLI